MIYAEKITLNPKMSLDDLNTQMNIHHTDHFGQIVNFLIQATHFEAD